MNGVDIAGGGGEAEDFLMSLCEPPGAAGVDGIGDEVRADGGSELVKALSREGGNRDRGGNEVAEGGCLIAFIEHEDFGVWELGYGGLGVGGVEDDEEEVGGVDLSRGDGDGVLFDWIVGGSEARGIE